MQGRTLARVMAAVLAAALAPAGSALAQAVPQADELPALPAQAAAPAGFVPAGWQIAQQHSADFNHDGRRDALLLLQPVPATPAAGPGQGRSPPRWLLLLLRQRSGWRLAEHNASLIPRVDLASQQDPLADGEISLQRGGFSLSLGLAATAGSYQSATLRYRFRLQPGCLRLIGYDRLQVHRATLDTQDLSINFLTGVVLQSTGNAQSDAAPRQKRERLVANPRRCLDGLEDAADFQPLAAPR